MNKLKLLFFCISICSFYQNGILASERNCIESARVFFSIEDFSFSSKNIKIKHNNGARLLNELRSSLQKSTTSSRKELKSAISVNVWNKIFDKIKNGPLKIFTRDAVDEYYSNSTFTYYGKKVVFKNNGVKTNFKMRIRYYIKLPKNEGDPILRADQTSTKGWLEIKIKHPSLEEKFGVLKLRALLPDEHLNALVTLDPNSLEFAELILKIQREAPLNPKNNSAEVMALTDTIFEMAKIDKKFARPKLAISYERTAYAFNEADDSIYSEFGNVQYQATLDENIVYYSTKNQGQDVDLDVVNYYNNSSRIVATYPDGILALEFKDPFPIANFGRQDRSKAHNFYYDNLVDVMHDEAAEGFKLNRGKFGNRLLFNELTEDDRIVIKLSDSFGESSYQKNLAKWTKKYNRKKLTLILEKIKNKDALKNKEITYIEKLKELGNELRNHFSLFHLTQEIPAELQKIIKRLGQLKDLASIKTIKKKKMKKVANQIISILESSKFVNDLDTFVPISGNSVKEYINSSNLEMLNYLNRSQITVYEFHLLKKYFRLLTTLYKSSVAVNGSKPLKEVFPELLEANKSFKSLNGEFVEDKLENNILYKEASVELDTAFIQNLKYILNNFELN
jgi:hypothetical protein